MAEDSSVADSSAVTRGCIVVADYIVAVADCIVVTGGSFVIVGYCNRAVVGNSAAAGAAYMVHTVVH